MRGYDSTLVDERPSVADEKYDVFISYSHRADRDLAVALQGAMQSIGRRLLMRPALKAFRDDTSLSANPNLWSSIEAGLAQSRYFVLVASPESAKSPWVQKEVRWWKANRERETLLLAQAAGELVWGTEDFEWERTTAVHQADFTGFYEHEPLWVDLRRYRQQKTDQAVDRDVGWLRNAAVSLAAPVHGIPRDELETKDLREMRRGRRIRRAAVAALSLLLVVALVLAVTTYQQLQIAQRQTAIAEARGLAGEAITAAVTDPVLSIQLALAAFRRDPSAQATTAVLQAFERVDHVDQFVEVGSGGTAAGQRTFSGANAINISASDDGRVIAVGGYGGVVRVWDRTDLRTMMQLRGLSGGTAGVYFMLSRDGRAIQTLDGVFAVPSGAVIYDNPPAGYAIQGMSGDGRYVGLVRTDRTGVAIVDLLDASRKIAAYPVDSTVYGSNADDAIRRAYATPVEVQYDDAVRANAVGLRGPDLAEDAAKWVGTVAGELRLYDLADGQIEHSLTLTDEPAGISGLGISADASVIVIGNEDGQVYALDGRLQTKQLLVQMPGEIRGIEVSRTGDVVVVGDAAGNVTSLRLGERHLRPLPGTAGVFAPSPPDLPDLQPSPDGRLLLTARPAGVELWSLDEQRKLADVTVGPPADPLTGPVLAFASDGHTFAVRGNGAVHLLETSSSTEIGARPLAASATPADIESAFTELLGEVVRPGRSEWSAGYLDSPRLSRSGRFAATSDELIRTADGARIALVGGSQRGFASTFGFADGDTVMVQHTSPSRESDTYRNTIDLWDTASGTRLGQWPEPLATESPGDQTENLVIAGGRTALTVRPNGEIGQWSVSPNDWIDQLCGIIAGTPLHTGKIELSTDDIELCP